MNDCCCDDVELFISIKEYKKNNNIFTQFYTQSPQEEEGEDEEDDINIEVQTLFDSGAYGYSYGYGYS